jgi:hypothetical protein
MRGAFAEGLATVRAMLDTAEQLDRPLARIWAAYALARVHLFKGDAEAARGILEPLLAQSRDVEFWAFYTRIAGRSAPPTSRAPALGRGSNCWKRRWPTPARPGSAAVWRCFSPRWGRGTSWSGGRRTRSERRRKALGLARDLHERGNETEALQVLAAVRMQRDPPDLMGAEETYGRGLALAAALGRRSTAARCHLGLGTVFCLAGQPARARAELSRAAEAFRALGMTSWLARAEVALGGLGPVG